MNPNNRKNALNTIKFNSGDKKNAVKSILSSASKLRAREFGNIPSISLEKSIAIRDYIANTRSRANNYPEDRMTPDSLIYLEFSRRHDVDTHYMGYNEVEDRNSKDRTHYINEVPVNRNTDPYGLYSSNYRYVYTMPELFSRLNLNATNGSSPAKSRRSKKRTYLCAHCGAVDSPLWRRFGDACLCNACSLYYRLHATKRPRCLVRPIIRRRRRTIPSPLNNRDCKK